MSDHNDLLSSIGLVARDQSDLLDLPLNYRWEFTRRHPYYLLLWQAARSYRRKELPRGTLEIEDGLASMYLLGMIGVTGEPPDPSSSFESLGDLDPAFLSGAVQPMTVRNMITLLVQALPPAELQLLRAVLDVAVNPAYAIAGDSDLNLQKQKAHAHLAQLSSPIFDSYPDCPLYYIHLDASQRRIVDDVEVHVRSWKARRNIPERRSRIQNLSAYLSVWDLHEGWKDGRYELESEQSFGQLAKQLGIAKPTAVNAYRAAFKRISGHDYTPELWIRVMGLAKFSALQNGSRKSLMSRYRRLISSNAPKPAPESRVERKLAEHGEVGLIERQSTLDGDQDLVELLLDASDLIQRGLADSDIAQKLDLKDSELVEYLRRRIADLRDIN